MSARYKIAAAVALGVFVLSTAVSCGPTGISQEDYDQVKASLDQTKQDLADVTQKLSDTISEYAASLAENEGIPTSEAELRTRFTELQDQFQAKEDELNALKAEYDNLASQISTLNDNYDSKVDELAALQKSYAEVEALYEAIRSPGPIDTAEVESLILDLVNQARLSNGLGQLAYGQYIQDQADENSQWMANNADTKFVEATSWQEIFRATGYTTAAQVADAALKLWKSNVFSYQQNVLPQGAKYGAVSAVKSGDVIYITFLASIFE